MEHGAFEKKLFTAEVAIAGRLVTSSLSRREDGCGAVRLQFRKALCVDVANM